VLSEARKSEEDEGKKEGELFHLGLF